MQPDKWQPEQGFSGTVALAEPSPWWGRAVAIIIGLLVAQAALNGLANSFLQISQIGTVLSEFAPENPGEYPENGTSEEQEEWNNSMIGWTEYNSAMAMIEELNDSGIQQTQALHSAILFILGLPVIGLAWVGHKKMAHFAGGWVALHASSSVYLQVKIAGILKSYYENSVANEGVNPAFMAYSGVGSALTCDLFLVAIIVVAAIQMKKDANEIPNSAFHQPVLHLNSTQPQPHAQPPEQTSQPPEQILSERL